jgi:hypothetical protein
MESWELRGQEQQVMKKEDQETRAMDTRKRLEKFQTDAEDLLADRRVNLGMAAKRLADSAFDGDDLIAEARMEITTILGRDADYAPEALAAAADIIRKRARDTTTH